MVAMIVTKAKDAAAVEAAEAVSSATKTGLGHNILSYFLIGIGIVAAAGGVTGIVRAKGLA